MIKNDSQDAQHPVIRRIARFTAKTADHTVKHTAVIFLYNVFSVRQHMLSALTAL